MMVQICSMCPDRIRIFIRGGRFLASGLWAELWSPTGVDPLVSLRPLPGSATILAIGEDCKAEPDARPLRRSRTTARRGRPARFLRNGFRTGFLLHKRQY